MGYGAQCVVFVLYSLICLSLLSVCEIKTAPWASSTSGVGGHDYNLLNMYGTIARAERAQDRLDNLKRGVSYEPGNKSFRAHSVALRPNCLVEIESRRENAQFLVITWFESKMR